MRTPQSRQGSKKDRPHARHPNLSLGKREGRGKEAVREQDSWSRSTSDQVNILLYTTTFSTVVFVPLSLSVYHSNKA